MHNTSLYDYIREHVQNGILPKDFSLPKDTDDKYQVTFADGARDGIGIYHMSAPGFPEESQKLLAKLLQTVAEEHYPKASRILEEFAQKHNAIAVIDQVEGYIYEHTDQLNPNSLHKFGEHCLLSSEREIVKYGMEILEVFSEPGESLKEKIRTLGLSDEFTIFAVFHMQHWTNGNAEIFALAQKVHGWGRIHAVERLEPETEEIRRWLLHEGIQNDIMPAYSALTVYEKLDIPALLASDLSDADFSAVSELIFALLDEGPVRGISSIEDADNMLLQFLSEIPHHSITREICNTVLALLQSDKKCSAEVQKQCEVFLHSEECKAAVLQAMQQGKGIALAKYLEIVDPEMLYQYLCSHFADGWQSCRELLTYADYREKTLQVFRDKLPLEKLWGEPTEQQFFRSDDKSENENRSRLMILVQYLADYPLVGTEFVLTALHSPIVSTRMTAIRVLDSWCQAKSCKLETLSPELYAAVSWLKTAEVSDSVKQNIEKYGF